MTTLCLAVYRFLPRALAWLWLFGCANFALAQVTFTDQGEREVRLDAPAQRVVTIPIPAASMVIALDGGPEHLVGMHHLSKTAIKGHILAQFFPDALAIPSNIVGKGFTFVPNVEELPTLEPDLVFQWGHLSEDIVAPLQNAG